MTAFTITYFIGFFVAFVVGLMGVLFHLDWEDSYLDYERRAFLAGWRIAIFSWAWPVLVAAGVISLYRLARRAAEPQGE